MKIFIRKFWVLGFVISCLTLNIFIVKAQTPPTLMSPSNNATCQPLTVLLDWDDTPNAQAFNVQVSENSDMSNPIINQATGSTSEYTATLGNHNLIYYWRVTALFPGPQTVQSAIWSFRTKPFAPNLTSPENNATCLPKAITFRWSGVSGATSYRLQVSEVSDFTTTVFDQDTIKSLLQTVSVPLYDKSYYWRVQAAQPCETEFSSTRVCSVSKAPPTLTSPPDNETFVSFRAVLRWTAAGSPNSYNLQVSDDTLFSVLLIDKSTTLNYDTIDVGSSNTKYFWRVRAIYSDCQTDFSNPRSFKTQYSGPRLQYPKNDTTCAQLRTTFSWDAVPGATAYRFQLSEFVEFSNIVFDSAGIKTTSAPIRLPKGLKKYFWRVRGEDQNNKGAWSPDTFTVTTNIELPDKISPANNDLNQSTKVNFKWKKSALTDVTYRLQVSKEFDFKKTEYDTSIKDVDNITLKLSSFFEKYYWRITAIYSTCKNEWSDSWLFGTVVLPPNLIAPSNNATKQPLDIEFEWSLVEGATNYEINISEESDFAKIIYGRKGLTSTKLLVRSQFVENKTYFWRVNAYNSLGTSVWSQIFKFTTGSKPLEAPVLVSPANGSTKMPTDLILNWNKVTDATFYHIQIAENENFNSPVVDLSSIINNSFEALNLKNAKQYFWRVAAANDNSISPWSQIWNFTTSVLAPNSPVIKIFPDNDASDVNNILTFKWQELPRAENYELQVSYSNTFFANDLVVNDTNVAETTKYFNGLSLGTTYYWRVLGKNEAGKGPWSEIWKFKTILTSVDEYLIKDINISVLPNPASEKIDIGFIAENPAMIHVSIINVVGQELINLKNYETKQGFNMIPMNLQILPNGLYFIRLQSNNIISTKEFIIRK